MSKYRCPKCRATIISEKVYDGRFIFQCSKCSISAIVPFSADSDEAYMNFLDQYDNGKVERSKNLDTLLEKERIVRSREEIESLLHGDGKDETVRNILSSRRDYAVDYKVIDEPAPEAGCNASDLGIDKTLAD
ncbi:MAG: DEAD/DEAH box helicase, partial [Nitrososphaerales archaeon]